MDLFLKLIWTFCVLIYFFIGSRMVIDEMTNDYPDNIMITGGILVIIFGAFVVWAT